MIPWIVVMAGYGLFLGFYQTPLRSFNDLLLHIGQPDVLMRIALLLFMFPVEFIWTLAYNTHRSSAGRSWLRKMTLMVSLIAVAFVGNMLTPPSPRREGLAWYLSLPHPSELTNKRLTDEKQAIEEYLASRPDAYEFVSVRREQLDKELKERTEILDKYAWAQHALDQNGDKPIVEEPGVSLSEHAQRKDLVYARNEAKFCVKQSAYQCAMNSPIAPLFPWLAPESTAYFQSKGIKGGKSVEQQKTPVQKSKKVQLPSAIRKKLLHL